MSTGKEETVQSYRQPRRYKLAILTYVGLLAPVYFIPPALVSVLSGPRLLIVGAAVAIIVALMTYLIMPALTHFAGDWLFDRTRSKSLISDE